MTEATVYAVMKVTLEIPVRASSPKETMEELLRVSKKEAERVLREQLPPCFLVSGAVQFSHAVVKENPK